MEDRWKMKKGNGKIENEYRRTRRKNDDRMRKIRKKIEDRKIRIETEDKKEDD